MASNRQTTDSFEIPARPPSTNSPGQTERLYTNHFTCILDNNISLYQYHVAIEQLDIKSNMWKECENRSQCASMMQSMISSHQLIPNIFVWYDERKCLYSTAYLESQIKLATNNRHRLNIKSLVNQWKTNDINDYIYNRTKIYPNDAVRIIEILLKRSLQDRIKVVKNKCYFLNKSPIQLDNGFEQRYGFIQTLNLSSRKITLNIYTKLTTFYSNISLLDFIERQIGSNRIPTNHDYRRLNNLLKNCIIITQQSRWKTEYDFDRFDSRCPNEISLEKGDLLTDYYRDKLKIKLTKLNYPCVQVYRRDYDHPCHLPLEVCRIKEWTVYDETLRHTHECGKKIPSPEERYYEIKDTLQECNYNTNVLCQNIGFHVVDEEMLQFNARILPEPYIRSDLYHYSRINNGRIFLDGHLYVPKPILALGITYIGTYFKENKYYFRNFADKLVETLKRYNIYESHEEYVVEPVFEEIDEYFSSMVERNCHFIVCVMNENYEDNLTQLRVNIKKCGTLIYGIMTQCVLFSEITSDEKSLRSLCENLVRKINHKNGGINTIVDLTSALNNRKFSKDFLMFFGADVIHPTNITWQRPSIAAIVGSGNSSCSTTAVRVCKQYPKQGKCSIETILGMKEMVYELLQYYKEMNGTYPNKIIFYRDGVSDGQFIKVLEYEIPAIRHAFDQIYGEKVNHPLLTFIIVKKRHYTRFFTYHPNGNFRHTKSKKSSEETDNMSIGCVIDTTIVHPYQHNFYLNSHNAYQGVNHPPLYHVLLDEISFTVDELQLLTYHLCFTDPRSIATEAIPSVVHQADLAALNARDLFCNDEKSSTVNTINQNRIIHNPTLDVLDYEILHVHENLKNKPVFN
ncbi:hypothetical protein I4U23_020169 [Adineta vaga]|nr:hypothetical protein I4U23_020169 [Adineta vaga]